VFEKIVLCIPRLVLVSKCTGRTIHGKDTHNTQQYYDQPDGSVALEIGFKPGHV